MVCTWADICYCFCGKWIKMCQQLDGFMLALFGFVVTIMAFLDVLFMWNRDVFAVLGVLLISIVASVAAICDSCSCNNKTRKQTNGPVSRCTGILFMMAGLMNIVAMIICTYIIIEGFYNSQATEEKRGELGISIIVMCLGSSLFLLLGGGIIYCTHLPRCCYDPISCC